MEWTEEDDLRFQDWMRNLVAESDQHDTDRSEQTHTAEEPYHEPDLVAVLDSQVDAITNRYFQVVDEAQRLRRINRCLSWALLLGVLLFLLYTLLRCLGL